MGRIFNDKRIPDSPSPIFPPSPGITTIQNLTEDLTLYLIETPFNAFANKADLDQAALIRAA